MLCQEHVTFSNNGKEHIIAKKEWEKLCDSGQKKKEFGINMYYEP